MCFFSIVPYNLIPKAPDMFLNYSLTISLFLRGRSSLPLFMFQIIYSVLQPSRMSNVKASQISAYTPKKLLPYKEMSKLKEVTFETAIIKTEN